MNKGAMLIDMNRVNWVTPIFDEYKKNCHLIDIDLPINEILKIVKERGINYIIIPLNYNKIDELKKTNIKIIIFIGNPPGNILGNKIYKDYCLNSGANDIIIHSHCSISLYKEWLEPMEFNIFYHKWGIPLDIFTDYKLEKTLDIVSTGKFSTYLYRRDLHLIFSRLNNINYERLFQNEEEQKHPNYNYPKKLNSSWITIGGCSMPLDKLYYNNVFINETFPKNLEIAGSKSCLLTCDWGDREFLGFRDGENCILFKNPREAVRKALYYLDDKELLMKITKSGYDLVQKNHNIVETIGNVFRDIEKKYG